MMILKSEARKIYKLKRKESTALQRWKWDERIFIQFKKLPLTNIKVLFTYVATDVEVNTDLIVQYLYSRNPVLLVTYPVCNFEKNTMQAVAAEKNISFLKNEFGIPEPDSAKTISPVLIDMVIVPLLCFDKDGFRVGYGKGFYDRFLSQTRKNVIKVGLSHYEAIDKIADRNKFDVPLNYCITPERFYEF